MKDFSLVVVTEDTLSHNNYQQVAPLNGFCCLRLFLVAFWLCRHHVTLSASDSAGSLNNNCQIFTITFLITMKYL